MESDPSSDNNAVNDAPSTDLHKADVRLFTSLVTPADLPALVEAELLSFAGTEGKDALARRLHPFRADLLRAGIPARRWPDFRPTLRRYKKELKDETTVMIKAEIALSSEIGLRNVPVGMALLRRPNHKPSSAGPRSATKMVMDLNKGYLNPVLDELATRLSGSDADGTDFVFSDVFKVEVRRTRKEVERETLHGEPYASLELLYVHPAYRGIGAGTTLLRHCLALSKVPSVSGPSVDLPILLESTLTATPLYIRFGFREVARSQIKYGAETYEWPVMLRMPEAEMMTEEMGEP